jgi:hypothetical protein
VSEPDESLAREAAENRLRDWALAHGWQIVFPNDALEADVRPGVVDAVMVRAHPRTPDSIQLQFVRLRIGGGRVPTAQARRLHDTLEKVSAKTLFACIEGDDLHFIETDELI